MTEKSFDDRSMEERCRRFDHNFNVIRQRIREAAQISGRSEDDITLLAATKTVPGEVVTYAVEHGLTHVGENRAQELLAKYDCYHLPVDNIHFIGHLQTNKVASVVGKVGMIQSVDSLKLANEIHKRSLALGKPTDVLIEVNVGEESAKSGVSVSGTETLIRECAALEGIRVRGLMAIPPVCDDPEASRKFFSIIYQQYVDIRRKNIDNVLVDVLSMGMSADYYQAICEGATMVRIGSLLFGERIY